MAPRTTNTEEDEMPGKKAEDEDRETGMVAWRPQAMTVIGGAPMTTPAEWEMMKDQAAWIARARIYPALKNPESVVAAMLAIRDMGLAMSLGLACAFEVEGRIGFEVKARLASLKGHVPTFQWEALEWDEKVCRIRGRLHSREPWIEFTYTRAEADKSKYTVNKEGGTKWNWQREPKMMLLYRCLTRWMTLHAIHVLMGLPPALLSDPGEPVDAEFEVVGSGPAAGGGKAQEATAATDAPATAAVKPESVDEPGADYRKRLAAAARKQGKTTNSQLLHLVGLLFTEDLGLEPPRSYQEIGPSDWRAAWGAFTKRYDPETGQPRKTPPAEAEVPSRGTEEPPEETEVGFPDDEEPPEVEPESLPVRVLAEQGDADALVTYAQEAEAIFRKAGRQAKFLTEHPQGSGSLYFCHGAILRECGSTKQVGNALQPVSVLLSTSNEAHRKFLAGKALVVMLARGVRNAIDDLEASR